MNRSKVLLAGAIMLISSLALAQTFGVKKRTPKPSEFGNVVMDNHAARVDSDPVLFPHWLHRAKYTCRLCHVDLGFAMAARETQMSEQDNRNGLYCGACHNGTIAFPPEEPGERYSAVKHCDRCHSQGKDVELKYDFYEFTKDFPRARFGNRVDWMLAEQQGLVVLEDEIEGISIPRRSLPRMAPTAFRWKCRYVPRTCTGLPRQELPRTGYTRAVMKVATVRRYVRDSGY